MPISIKSREGRITLSLDTPSQRSVKDSDWNGPFCSHWLIPEASHQLSRFSKPVAYRGLGEGGWGFKPPPLEIPKALQNRAKLNPIVKTVKIAENRTPASQDVRKKKAVKF